MINDLRVWAMRLWLAATVLWLALALGADAQSLVNVPGLGAVKPAETEVDSNVARIMEEAARNGVGVVVIGADGTVLSAPAPQSDGTAEAGDAEGGGAGVMAAQESINAFRAALFERLQDLPTAVNEVVFILRASSPDGTIFAYFLVLIYSLGLFLVGMVGERYIYGPKIAGPVVLPLIQENPVGYSGKMPFLVVRFVFGLLGVVFTMAVAYVLGYLIFGGIEDSAIQYTATLVNIGYFSARFATGLWRMILSPYLAQYRIPRLTDQEARKLYLWLCCVVIAWVVASLLGEWIRELGLNRDVGQAVTAVLVFIVMILNVALVLANRKAINAAILNRKPPAEASWFLRTLVRLWVPLVLLYFIYAWMRLVNDLVLYREGAPMIAGAYLILTTVLIVYGVINFGIERSFARARALRAMNVDADETGEAPGEDTVAEHHAATRHLTTFEDLARRIAGIIAFVAGGYAFLNISAPATAMLESTLPYRLLDILVIIFIGYIVYHAFRIWIDTKILEEQGDEEPGELGDEGSGSSASRLATLLPLFRNIILIVIVVAVALIALMEMGVNVGPLFAGAGIVGVAVGFGSQTLVRDIFSGAFFLFDDAFRKGEYIEIGDVRGTVEKISVRSFQLRHHLGKLHTIPFGEIQVLTNYSRDWVMMKLPLRVTYDTDVERVRKLIKKLGQSLLEDPVIGEDFIQPLKSQGVIEMQDSAMIIRVKFMTKPGDQWVIRKRVFQEIRDLFEREGIKFAHREVTVRLADEPAAPLSEKQKEAVAAAAEAAIIEEDMDGPERGDDR